MPAREKQVLLLGGTAEAAEMAGRLHDRGINVLTSLAGRTREPAPITGKVRTGGFGGVEGLAAFIRENHINLLIDMTHPFATHISENARKASVRSGIPLLAWHRPGWEKTEGDQWIEVADIRSAVSAIPHGARALLALGSQHIAPFAVRADVHFLVRMVDQPEDPLKLPDHAILTAKPGSLEAEFALLRDHNISHIICRNSGGKTSYAKIAAARLLGLPVIIIGRHLSASAGLELDAFRDDVMERLAELSDQT